MSINLLIVCSSQSQFTIPFERVVCTTVRKKKTCSTAVELLRAVREISASNSALIDTLDLYSHGGYGHFDMDGGAQLFRADGTGRTIARGLRPFLTTNARVRLLGCTCAVGEPGRGLLLMLRQAFGGSVVVFGMMQTNGPNLFNDTGFDQTKDELLFSSTEAETTTAPDLDTLGALQKLEVELNAFFTSNLPEPR